MLAASQGSSGCEVPLTMLRVTQLSLDAGQAETINNSVASINQTVLATSENSHRRINHHDHKLLP